MATDQGVKRKRGRPRKNPLPEEIQTLVDEVKKEPVKEEPKQETQKEEPIKEEIKKDWDFKLDDDIPFFDSSMSYELTGYKPINDKQGLDFDPNWFLTSRNTYNQTGHYCEYRFGSKAYADFWDTEYDRCRNGMTVNGYTITGDHYFFLNYYQLPNLHTAKAGTGRAIDFPDFYVPQYEWFHYLELCKRLRKNAALMKARGLKLAPLYSNI